MCRRVDCPHVLVTGSPRSGTTWVGNTICQHPALRYVSEPFNVDYPLPSMGLTLTRWFEFAPASPRRDDIAAAFDAYLKASPSRIAARICKLNGWSVTTPWQFIRQAIELAKRRRLLVKDPLALLSAQWLHERYGFKVVCLYRSPLAFVGSMRVAQWDMDFENFRSQKELMAGWLAPYKDAVEHMCRESSDFIDRACLVWNLLHHVIEIYRNEHPSWLFVCYEDLAMEPVAGFRDIFEYLGLALDAAIEQYVEEFTREGNPRVAPSIYYQPRASRESLRTWEDRLSSEEIDRVKHRTSATAKLFYEDPDRLSGYRRAP